MPAKFTLGPNGLRIRPDPNDNPEGHPDPHSECGLAAVFEIANTGDEEGVCTASMWVDGTPLEDWVSDPRAPGEGVNAVHPVGRHGIGDHEFLISLDPPGEISRTSDTITIDA